MLSLDWSCLNNENDAQCLFDKTSKIKTFCNSLSRSPCVFRTTLCFTFIAKLPRWLSRTLHNKTSSVLQFSPAGC